MSLFEKLHPASFRNVGFLVETETVTRGKKTVIHEYPNSDDRYVEEIGKLPPTFALIAIVHGDDAINQRLRLEDALERPGLGLLVHPVYGNLNVKSLSFKVDSSQIQIGLFKFDIQFSSSRENIAPEPDIITGPTISALAADAKSAINNRLTSLYKVPSTPSVFESTANTINSAFKKVHDTIGKVVDKTTAGAAGFDRVYRSITGNMTSIVSSAQTMRDNITLFYDTALDVPLFIDQLGAAWDNLIDYPFTVSTAPITTHQNVRDQNNTAIIEHLKLTALANSYEAQAYTDYDTDVELFTAMERLNDVYNDFFTTQNKTISDLALVSIANDGNTREAFAALRIKSRKIFDEKEKTAYRIVNVDTPLSSMSQLVYRYYGNIDLIDRIISLNRSVNVTNFSREIRVLAK